MMLQGSLPPYDKRMLATTSHKLRAWARHKECRMPAGFGWLFVIHVDVTMLVICAVVVLQRPVYDLPIAGLAVAIAFFPVVLFFGFDVRWRGEPVWAAWVLATAILLFGTSTPIAGDFAPLLLTLGVGVVSAITTLRRSILSAAFAAALLVCAAALHRLDTPLLYLAWVAIGWIIGYLMLVQQRLILKQRRMQQQLADLVAADERRRIAREVHDVIAHSLSVTMLHLTGARHLLTDADGDPRVVHALKQAENLGREAMADIRRTVGLLDTNPQARTPEPGIADIPYLVKDFTHAGLVINFEVEGRSDVVSAAAGLALYRVAQESLSNVAKHALNSPVTVSLALSEKQTTLSICNILPTDLRFIKRDGRGLAGMRQRIELLDGTIDIGPRGQTWSVSVVVPSHAEVPVVERFSR